MTKQQKLLWEKLTKDVAESGEGNLRARELYDELCKIMEMEDKIIIALIEKENGIEISVDKSAYGNLVIVGLLEKIKMTILDNDPVEQQLALHNKNQSYDA